MGSGLNSGDAYPISATTPSPSTASATILNTDDLESSTTSLRISSITQATTTSNAVDIIFSTGLDGTNDAGYVWASTFIGFFWSGSDTRVRQEYYYQAAATISFDGALVAFTTTNPPAVDGTNASTTNETGITVGVKVQTTANLTNDLVHMVFPRGVTFGTTPTFTFKTGSDTYKSIKQLSSTTRFYQFPSLWAQVDTITGNSLTGGTITNVSSIATRISNYGVSSAGNVGYVLYNPIAANTDACDHGQAVDWVANFFLGNSTKELSTCSISLTATNTQSAATKNFT
jgi:hypothetical protein